MERHRRFLSVALLLLVILTRLEASFQDVDWTKYKDILDDIPEGLRNELFNKPAVPTEERMKIRLTVMERQIAYLTAKVQSLESRISKTHPIMPSEEEEVKTPPPENKPSPTSTSTTTPTATTTPTTSPATPTQELATATPTTQSVPKSSPPPIPKEKTFVSASIASTKGSELALKDAVDAMEGQVDRLYVYLDGYSTGETLPTFLQGKGAWLTVAAGKVSDHGLPQLTGKWYWASKLNPGYHILLEDNILYPKDYVAKMTAKIEEFGRKAIVGINADILISPFETLEKSTTSFHYSTESSEDQSVHILHTETMAYHTDTFKVPEYSKIFTATGDALIEDVIVSKLAQSQQLPLFAIAHPANWLKPNDPKKVAKRELYLTDFALGTGLVKKTSKEWKRRLVKPRQVPSGE